MILFDPETRPLARDNDIAAKLRDVGKDDDDIVRDNSSSRATPKWAPTETLDLTGDLNPDEYMVNPDEDMMNPAENSEDGNSDDEELVGSDEDRDSSSYVPP